MPTPILKLYAAKKAPTLQIMFAQTFNERTLSSDWLQVNIIPVLKKGDRSKLAKL